MKKMRLMDRLEDFRLLRIDPDKDEPWEDGVRGNEAAMHNEVWYFDAILDDGSKFVTGWRPTRPAKMRKSGYFPDFNIAITPASGKTQQEFMEFDISECSFSKELCDVHMGSNYVTGDFSDFDIHIEDARGLGCDLRYHALLEPFRQGTGVIEFDGCPDNYYTDLPVIKCEVTGTLFYDGQNHEVHGFGYHDHQWMSMLPFSAFHHWLWGHLYTKNYTVYIYDFVGTKTYGFKRVPFFGVQDNRTGKTLFCTNGNIAVDTKLQPQCTMGKDFPKMSHYYFDNQDGNFCTFDIKWKEEIEVRNMWGDANFATKVGFVAMGVRPTYIRYFAHGSFNLNLDGELIAEDGDMIYEYNYMGKVDPNAGV